MDAGRMGARIGGAAAWRWALLAGAGLLAALTAAVALGAYFKAPYMDMVDSELAAGQALASPSPVLFALGYRSNEHLTAVAGVLTLIDRAWFAADGGLLVVLMLLAALAASAILARASTAPGADRGQRVLAWAAGLFALFAFPIAGGNFVWPHQIELVICAPFALGALAVMSAAPDSRRQALVQGIGAGVLALLAAFSFGWGAAVIPIVALAALCGRFKLERLVAAILPLTVIAARLYSPDTAGGSVWHLSDLAPYIAALTGNLISRALAGDKVLSLILGGLGALAMIGVAGRVLWRWGSGDAPTRPERFFALVGLWTLAAIFLTALGRSDFGYVQGFVARYTLISALFWFALAGLAIIQLRGRWPRRIASGFGVLVLVGLVAATPGAIAQQRQNASAVDAAAAGAVLGIDDPASAYPIYPAGNDAKVAALFAQLHAEHASVFRQPWIGWINQPLSKVGVVDGCIVRALPMTATPIGPGQRLSGPAPFDAPAAGEWLLITDANGVIRGLARDGLPTKRQAWGYARLPVNGEAHVFVKRGGKLCQTLGVRWAGQAPP